MSHRPAHALTRSNDRRLCHLVERWTRRTSARHEPQRLFPNGGNTSLWHLFPHPFPLAPPQAVPTKGVRCRYRWAGTWQSRRPFRRATLSARVGDVVACSTRSPSRCQAR